MESLEDQKAEDASKIDVKIKCEESLEEVTTCISDDLALDEDPSKSLNFDAECALFENFEASANDFFDETPLSNFTSQKSECMKLQDAPSSPLLDVRPSLKRKISEVNSNDTDEFSSQSFEDESDFQPVNYHQNYDNNYQHYQSQQQSWQYHNYLQQQSHYGFIPQQYSNYSYNVYTQPLPLQQPATIAYVQNDPQQQQQTAIKSPKNLACTVCVRAFKTTSNLLRHFNSKTHQKKMKSKKQPRIATEMPKNAHGSVTDISDEERKILWQIDDEIYEYLNELEVERNSRNISTKVEIFPTPPLSPLVKV